MRSESGFAVPGARSSASGQPAVARFGVEGVAQGVAEKAETELSRIHPARAAGRCTWADQPVIAGGLFLVRRALAALRWFAMRPRAYLIGSSSTMLGS